MEKLEDLNKDHLLNQQLIDMGFENYSPILNLGGVFLLIVFYFIQLGLALILFSLFIKLGVAPFHLWSLDVYEGSPTSSTFFFAVITKLSIIALLARICYKSFFILNECWIFYSI